MVNSQELSPPSAVPPETPSASGAPRAANPAALTVQQLARSLGVPEERVRAHIAAGAPTGSGGTINLVHYVAWLNKELGGTDGD